MFICNITYSQVAVNKNFNLELVEKDSIKSSVIERSLNGFLTEALNQDYSNEYVDTLHLKKYEFFFAKLSGIGNNSESIKFNPPNIVKSYSSDGEEYRLTVAFTGLKKKIPFVYQLTELIAVPYLDHYRFYCPFEENTKDFNKKKIKTVTYFFSRDLNELKANEFADFKDELSELTKTPKSNLDYYCFQNLDELLKSYGFLYSARQCNFLCYDLGFSDNEGEMFLTGTNNENYLSEYVADFLYYNLPNRENMYGTFAIGVSTYYGGYGITNASMDELKQDFRNKSKHNPDFNFLEEFKKGRKSSVNRHFSHYVISAFLCEEVLMKGNFEDLLSLIYSGDNGEMFFKKLKEILNLDESNFNQTVARIINEK